MESIGKIVGSLAHLAVLWLVVWLAAGCIETVAVTSTPVTETPIPPTPGPTSLYPWTDENAVMTGVCFEAANDAAGKLLVLRSALDHIHFYEQVDNSHLCRHPVQRNTFDFSKGRVLAGLWSRGKGCKARHDVTGIERDDGKKTLTIHLHFVTEGDCDYELVRPFWIGLDGVSDYAIQIVVQS